MEYAILNTGAKMPLEGFGVFQIPDAVECEQVAYNAIKTGYRLIDTAAAYRNEEAVGKAVARAVADGLTTREELFITTKVWVTDQKTEDSAYQAVKTSLAKLNMPYVDLILLHQPMGDYFAAYRGITKAYKGGLTKAIGVANFYPGVLTNFCETVEIIPAVNQVELHPFFAQERHCPAGVGAFGGRQTLYFHRSGTGKNRGKIRQKRGAGGSPLERATGRVHYSEIRA